MTAFIIVTAWPKLYCIFAQADTVHPGVDDVGNVINSGVVVHQDLLKNRY